MSGKQLAVSQEFQDNLSKKIKDQFFDMLPEEKFKELIEKEMSAFFEDTADFEIKHERNSGFGYSEGSSKIISKVSPFRLIIWECLNELCRERLQEFLNSDNLKVVVGYDEHGGQQTLELSELLDKKLESIAMDMAKNMFSGMFGAAVQQAKQEIETSVNTAFAQRGW